jgi:hypothetical protein
MGQAIRTGGVTGFCFNDCDGRTSLPWAAWACGPEIFRIICTALYHLLRITCHTCAHLLTSSAAKPSTAYALERVHIIGQDPLRGHFGRLV